MKKKSVFLVLFFIGLMFVIILLMQGVEILLGGKIAMLFPQGIIALKERNLLFLAQGLMLLIVIPVFILTFIFVWKYRADNAKANYNPNWAHSSLIEFFWWVIPFLIIAIIGTATWIRTYELDPYRPIKSENETLTIQVVALQWKWLFLYPQQKIASLNFLQFPAKTPIRFEITADAPMNSFWIPQLGGQIFAMPRMRTELNLMAESEGSYRGSSANISGAGFSSMHFIAKATSSEEFEKWVDSIKHSEYVLDFDSYSQLAKPSILNPETYQLKEENLFNRIIMKYMAPGQ